jgi:hypothetical protein
VAQHAVLERIKAAVSGDRWPARPERRSLRLDDRGGLFDRMIDRGGGKVVDRHHRRWRRHRTRESRGGYTDRAEIVGVAVVLLALLLVGTWMCQGRDQYTGIVAVAVDRVNVAKGQGKIDRERNQCAPPTLPDIVPEPAHAEPMSSPPGWTVDRRTLSDPPVRSMSGALGLS